MFDYRLKVVSILLYAKFIGNGEFEVNQYYIIRSTDEKDEKVDEIAALSLEEAHAIAKVRFQVFMNSGETLHTIQANETLSFDENHRLNFPKGEMMSLSKWS